MRYSEEFTKLKSNVKEGALIALRKKLLNGLRIGLNAVDPKHLIQKAISWKNDSNLKNNILLIVGSSQEDYEQLVVDLDKYSSILVVGGGKATAAMADALLNILGGRKKIKGSINIPHGQEWGEYISLERVPANQNTNSEISNIEITYAGHPIPDSNGLKGTRKIVNMVKSSAENTLIFVLISGGGSALMPLPKKPLSLADLQTTNTLLLESGADINEINSVRKHLSAFKGGNLAKKIHPRRGIALIISDVIGNPLDVIASGPSVPDETVFQDALNTLRKYNILEDVPPRVKQVILNGTNGEIPENPKTNDEIFSNMTNLIIGSAENAKAKMIEYFKSNSIRNITEIDNSYQLDLMKGEAKEYGVELAHQLQEIDGYLHKSNNRDVSNDDSPSRLHRRYFMINSGEFTVTISGNGKGGRNQEMLLGFLNELSCKEIQYSSFKYTILSVAFDGIEGNSPAAGAIVDSETLQKIKEHSLNIRTYLKDNNSYNFFKKLGDAIEIGQTGTNTNDICAIIIELI
ncbi:MAG: DUF4147 domain-containing protein [Candidatus Lokiarchaeota archaeon]|nr:DUF4147 domain-containing protein [Candidatus Lokiarchaeota archaeon]